ncbi:MAG: hypothetical protein JNN13_03765 [Planctomycetes bacterium]|nr:hypothetical protein [Planctomycetota bacterium]
MSAVPDSDLPEDLQELIVDVVDGRCAAGDERVRDAGRRHPGFTVALAGAQTVRRCLDDLGRHEAAALAAAPSALDAVAEAATRRCLQAGVILPARWRMPRWLPFVLAAAVVVVVYWFGFPDARRGSRPGDHHLNQGAAVVLVFDAERHELVLTPAPVAGESYRIEFGSGDAVIATRSGVRAGRLSMPDLRRYLPDLWVRAVLCEVGEDKLPSGRIVVPVDFWR